MQLKKAALLITAPCSLAGAFTTPSLQRSRIGTHIFQQQQEQKAQDFPTAELKQIEAETPPASLADIDSVSDRIISELKGAADSLSIAFEYVSQDAQTVSPEDIVKLCDVLEKEIETIEAKDDKLLVESLGLKKSALEFGRYHLLTKLMKKDYEAYVATASFLSPTRIDRLDLPNIQDVPFNDIKPSMKNGEELVDDCTLEEMKFNDSILDTILLKIFRGLVEKNTGGVSSSKKGIDGLLDQGRTFMLQPDQTAEAQHKMVSDTLGGLMTPVLPPFYRIFMSGIVPKLGTDFDGKQIGPWFYAPWLTTMVTPTFFGFLVGPSRPNRRKDGERGGLVVEKCKFLQESGCKGLCLHQCKLPAQQFFKNELGLELSVSPNFATQECQWSFGEAPLAPREDPSFPSGCLKGCESRAAIANSPADSLLSCN